MEHIYKPIRLGIHYTHHYHFATSVCNKNMVAKIACKTIGMHQLSTTHNWVHDRMSPVFVTGSRIIGDRQRERVGDEGDR
jgi:hypothetical protein